MNSNLKLFRPLFSYLFWNTNFCAMFPFCLVPLMWNVILYPTSTRMFYYHFNKIHIIIDNFHLKIEKKTKQKTKGSFILTAFCQHVHVLPMKPHHKINFFYYNVATRYNRDTYSSTKSYDPCREGPSLQAAENINSVSLEYYIYVFLKSHMQIFNITKYKL